MEDLNSPISENINLIVPENRFVYLKCKEKYKSRYLNEILYNIYMYMRLKLPVVVPARIWSVVKKLKPIIDSKV